MSCERFSRAKSLDRNELPRAGGCETLMIRSHRSKAGIPSTSVNGNDV